MSIRQTIKRVMPPSILTNYRQAKFQLRNLSYIPQSCRSVFQNIYANNEWGSQHSVSGPGSEPRETEDIRELLPPLLQRLDVRSILDIPCGDFFWMKHVDLSGYDYIGADVVPALIESNRLKHEAAGRKFICANLTEDDPLPKADLILCRDCLIHLSFKDALAAVKTLQRSGAHYLLITTNPTVEANQPIRTGGYRSLNLQLPPFSFPRPQELHRDRYSPKDGEHLIDPHKSLGLWALPFV